MRLLGMRQRSIKQSSMKPGSMRRPQDSHIRCTQIGCSQFRRSHARKAQPAGAVTIRRVSLLVVSLLCLMAAGQAAQTASDALPRVIFTKEFPNSKPEYFSVVVRENGAVLYRTAPDDDAPLELRLSPEQTKEIFSLAEKLNWFQDGNLESGRKVANMGKKTLAYQNSTESNEAVFNHTEVPEALALAALFERISQTEQHFLRLEYLVRFDRLGVVKELLHLEANLNHGRLLGTGHLIPLLEKIRKNRALVRVAQARAAQIIAKIQSGKY